MKSLIAPRARSILAGLRTKYWSLIAHHADSTWRPSRRSTVARTNITTGTPLRLALLSPYWGGNLGDAAILQSVIDNLRQMHPSVEFVSITMCPWEMRRSHGIRGTKLVSFRRNFYSAFVAVEGRAARGQGAEGHAHGLSLARCARSFAAGSITAARDFVKRLWNVVQATASESHHFLHALRVIKDVDALVVAGGGQLDEEWGGAWGHPYALYKWSCAARLMRRPTVFLSVGACQLQSPLSQWFAARALEMSSFASLRDPWSRDFVASRLNQHACSLAPDLAFSIPIQAGRDMTRPVDRLTIGVSPIAYGRPDAWPTAAPTHSENYLQVLGDFVASQLNAGHSIVLFHTDTPDKKIAAQMVESLRGRISSCDFARLREATTDSLGELFALLPTLDMVVASRLHGLILSHVHAIPSLAISYDRKVSTHMTQVGHSDVCLDLHDIRLDELVERFSILKSHRLALQHELTDVRDRWRRDLDLQYRNFLRLVTGSSGGPHSLAGRE